MSKEGVRGLNSKIYSNVNLSMEPFEKITNGMIDNLYFTDNKVSYLIIVIFQNKNQYEYKLYKTKENLINGEYSLISCKTGNNSCNVCDNGTTDNNGKRCTVNHINNKNKTTSGNILCSGLALSFSDSGYSN